MSPDAVAKLLLPEPQTRFLRKFVHTEKWFRTVARLISMSKSARSMRWLRLPSATACSASFWPTRSLNKARPSLPCATPAAPAAPASQLTEIQGWL